MNSVFPFLNLTVESEGDYADGYIPTLDLKAKMKDDGTITYKYYEKPMANKFLIMEAGALGKESQNAILVQEVYRRMINTSLDQPQSIRNQIIDTFDARLLLSGYDRTRRQEIIRRGLLKFTGLMEDVKAGNKVFHRMGKDGYDARVLKKLLGDANWYKTKPQEMVASKEEKYNAWETPEKGGSSRFYKKSGQKPSDIQPVAVLFVKRTPGGKLLNKMREVDKALEEVTNIKVRMVERPGSSLKNLL